MYAEDTRVPVEKTRIEIDALLSKHGAEKRGIAVDDGGGRAQITFVRGELQYRLTIPLPTLEEVKTTTPRPPSWGRMDAEGKARWVRTRWEQRCRSRWRQVLLLLKAKFEAVAMKVATIEHEFMADLVLPGGETLEVALGREIHAALGQGKMPTLMLPEATR